MSEVPDNLYYTADHEWLLIADGVAVIGITDYAQDSLTDIVYVELPDGGSSFKSGEEFAMKYLDCNTYADQDTAMHEPAVA